MMMENNWKTAAEMYQMILMLHLLCNGKMLHLIFHVVASILLTVDRYLLGRVNQQNPCPSPTHVNIAILKGGAKKIWT